MLENFSKNEYIDTNKKSAFILTSVKSAFKGILFSLAILAAFAVVITYTDLSEKNINLISILTTISGAILAGIFASRATKTKGWLSGMAAALFYFLILFVIGLIFFEKDIQFLTIIKKMPIFLLTGAIGGIIGINVIKQGSH